MSYIFHALTIFHLSVTITFPSHQCGRILTLECQLAYKTQTL